MSETKMLDRRKAPAVKLMGDLRLPEPRVERLSNGVTLYMLDGASQPVTQLTLMWQGGATEGMADGCKSPSLAKIFCAMLREGTKEMSGAEISELLDFNGAMLRVSADQHYTTLSLTSLNSMIANVLPVVRDVITCPTFPEETFERLRENTAYEYRLQMSKVMFRANLALMEMMKGKSHPEVAEDSEELIRSITVDDLRRYYSSTLTASGCRAYLSGQLDETVYRLVREMLESLPVTGEPRRLDIVPYQMSAPGSVTVDMPDMLQAAVCIGLPAPLRDDPDYVPLRFTVMGLGGFFGSRLMKNIREDKGYTYGISSYLLGSREGSMINIAAQADPSYVPALIEEVGKELTGMATKPFDDSDMQRLRQHISMSLLGYLDSSLTAMEYYRTIHCIGLPEGYFDRQVKCLHSLTASDICRMSEKYLLPGQMRVAIAK